MLRNEFFSVYLTTLYLLVYSILLQFEASVNYAIAMLLFSPLIICWMVYSVLKHGEYNGRELGNDEFGYQDKPKSEKDIF
jgi:hypothetical protein